MSSASARVGATHMATSSPTWRTLPVASTGCSEILNPGNPETARIGLTPSRSAAVKTLSLYCGGIDMPRIQACASGLRTNATSCRPARRMSATNSPRPRIKRSSSLRRWRAPTPCSAMRTLNLRVISGQILFCKIARSGRNQIAPPSRLPRFAPGKADGLKTVALLLVAHRTSLQKVDLQLDALAAIDDVTDIDGDAAVIDHHAMRLHGRRADRNHEQIGDLRIRAADSQALVRLHQRDLVHGVDRHQRGGALEPLGVHIEHITGQMQVHHRIWLIISILHAAQLDIARCRLAVAFGQIRLRHVALDRQPARNIVLQRLDQAVPVGRELHPVPVMAPLGDESAKPLARLQHAFFTQDVDRLPDGDARDLKFALELFQRRDLLAGAPLPRLDPSPQHRRDLDIQRHPASIVGFQQLRHIITSLKILCCPAAIITNLNTKAMHRLRTCTHVAIVLPNEDAAGPNRAPRPPLIPRK